MNKINYFNYSKDLVEQAKHVNNNDKKSDFFEPIIGLSYGNMDRNLYDPYRNYKPVILNKNDLHAYRFALVDLELYLDTHPFDQETLRLYKEYLWKYHTILDKFEKENYPICNDSVNIVVNDWQWIKNWQVKGDGK